MMLDMEITTIMIMNIPCEKGKALYIATQKLLSRCTNCHLINAAGVREQVSGLLGDRNASAGEINYIKAVSSFPTIQQTRQWSISNWFQAKNAGPKSTH